nr:MAG TPA: hypothetical protein [Caudoviricetes sp.]
MPGRLSLSSGPGSTPGPFFLPCLSWRGFSCCPSVRLSVAF